MTTGSLMKVESIATCSFWSILQYFWPALSDNWSWKPFFVFSGVAVLHRFYGMGFFLVLLQVTGDNVCSLALVDFTNNGQKEVGYRGSCMSVHVLLHLLNKLGKRDKMRGLPSILSLFRNRFNKFNNTRAWMLDSIYHMTFILLWNLISDVKRYNIVIL